MSTNEVVTHWPAKSVERPVAKALQQPMADYYLMIALAAALTGFGLFMVLSASSVIGMDQENDPYYFGKWQLLFAVIGVGVAFILSRLNARVYSAMAIVCLLVIMIVLAVVIAKGGPGVAVGDQQAWLKIGSLRQVQPSEFAKPIIIVWGAAVFSQPRRAQNLDNTWRLILPYLPMTLMVLGLVIGEKDLGTALIFAVIILLQLWLVGAKGKVIAALVAVFGAGGGVVFWLSPTHLSKFTDFLAFRFPSLHLTPSGASDQPDNAIFALASGGWWGTGPGTSRQKWGGLYNGAHTDYILAVLGEELGLFGILIVLGLLFLFVWTGIRIAKNSTQPNSFWRLAASGVTGWIAVQALINTMVAFGLLPVIGVTFPFLSYGGSSLLACSIGVGVLLAAARNEPEALKARALVAQRKKKR